METGLSKNVEKDIQILINKRVATPKEVLKCLPILFRISRYLLEKQNYSLLKSDILIREKSWLKYAPCAINEGLIFFKRSNKKRIEIFKEIPSLQENKIRVFLLKNFKIKEVLK
ncbi:MAG: hypothetical protein ABIK66_06165 [candidate division WOR-3 bacterium]